jgi:hypothetical protein
MPNRGLGSYESVADEDPYAVNGDSYVRRGSAGTQAMMSDPDRVRARQEADAHLHTYISRELEKLQVEREVNKEPDEFEVEA